MDFIGNKDTDTERVCGTCGKLLPVTDFFKDGKTPNGKIKYRRDCRECYRYTRLQNALLKDKKNGGNF